MNPKFFVVVVLVCIATLVIKYTSGPGEPESETLAVAIPASIPHDAPVCKDNITSYTIAVSNLVKNPIRLGCEFGWRKEFAIRVAGDGWEPKTRLLLDAQIRKGGVKKVLEAGMHLGDHLILLALSFPHVNFYGLDPDQGKCAFIENVLQLNNIKNLQYLRGGLCDEEKMVIIDKTNNNPGMWKVEEAKQTNETNGFWCYTIDKLTEKFGDFDMLHLDVEGGEDKAFHGAKQLLQRKKPQLVFENDKLEDKEALYRYFRSFGYTQVTVLQDEYNELWM
eukprot:m.341306 g.341306  ORF g.341306 m.341306 type:complete len:278 (-) comp19989_c0_seq1:36-869(-)